MGYPKALAFISLKSPKIGPEWALKARTIAPKHSLMIKEHPTL